MLLLARYGPSRTKICQNQFFEKQFFDDPFRLHVVLETKDKKVTAVNKLIFKKRLSRYLADKMWKNYSFEKN